MSAPRRDGGPPAAGRGRLVEELHASREAILQACWAQQTWAARELATTDGTPLKVLFQGWLNRGPGPDFREARLALGDAEVFGDVEVHLEDGTWNAHGHRHDPAFDRVALHVVLHHTPGQQVRAPVGRPIPTFHAGAFLSPQIVAALGDPAEMLRRYESLPGRCGLRAGLTGHTALQAVIARAAEVRARQKADRLATAWEAQPEEQTLYEAVFRSLGYQPYAEAFAAVARRFPLADLADLLQLPPARARAEVLGRWMGALGLLEPPGGAPVHPAAADDLAAWRAAWEAAGRPRLADPLRRRPSRPWNAPERRLVGLFHHLHGMGRDGWLKAWLAFLHDLDALRDGPHLKREALALLGRAFATPAAEPWRRLVGFTRPPLARAAQLVGADRVTVVMANAVVPFFLAYARRRGDLALEKLLYRLFIVLPPEAPNRRTRFMEQRMLLLHPAPRTLRSQQGLLQIHQDFCLSFNAGCADCDFPDLIAPPFRPPEAAGPGPH